MNNVAEYTRKIMNDKGLKQKSVAEKAGYSQQQFSNLLTGRKFFGANDVLRIATALKVTPNDLFGFSNDSTEIKSA
ncbi:helix-turn-helix transcriptional regulator [Porcipelethomonas sp.]|uniref:helix-turn-helix domain-containing protein n=1 Tax=Porcipelethomonas sp. TaxID=2981675 RepID=UPI003076D071